EKAMILRTLEETGGNRTHAARILGITRRMLQLRLKD
ncbi:MAG: helix-turn-helix domain-containing protein, partial [Deltaproteobacteria bacterium]|nr:helix-turn-helix domain-containing protein [Deltaproteobacteria bacterium]